MAPRLPHERVPMSIRRFILILFTMVTMLPAQSNKLIDPPSTVATTPAPTSPSVFTTRDRLRWVVLTTVGPKNLTAGVFVAGFNTWRDRPEAYSTHWDGFAQRYGARLAAGGTSHVLEAGLGSLWGEDPRYFRTTGLSMKGRVGYVIKMTFMANNRNGKVMPAYARYVAFPASSFISNEWTPHSQSNTSDAVIRVGLGFLSRMGENAYKEFIARRK